MRLAIPEVGRTAIRVKIAACARSDSLFRTCATRSAAQTLIQLRDETAKGHKTFPRIEELLSLNGKFFPRHCRLAKQAIPQLERVEVRLLKWPLDGLTTEASLRRSERSTSRPTRPRKNN
jgi:hypothetical protein